MKNWKLFPQLESVAKYIECYWYLEKEPFDQRFSFPKLNPDPSAHLIIAKASLPSEYAYDSLVHEVKGSHWLFPYLNTLTMDHSEPFKVIGIKFKIGALYSLNLRQSNAHINNIEAVDLNHLVNCEELNIDSLMTNAFEQKEQVRSLLDKILMPWLSESNEDRHSQLVRKVLGLLDNTSVTEIGEILNRSQRTVERSFKRVVGLSMKQVQTMTRFEALLDHIFRLKGKELDWAEIANRYGFTDQPHLIRHLKETIGKTPSAYQRDRDLTIDIYGNFEVD